MPRYFSLLLSYFLFCTSAICFAQTAEPRYPINGDRVSPNPKFTANPASLVSTGVTYNVVVSEQPRGGGAGIDQYIDFWTKEGLPASALLDSNLNRLGWDSTWVRKTRNGSYTGAAVIVPNSTPASLTYGKKYYWHIYGTNGTKSVENTFTIIESARPAPIHLSPANGAVVSASSQNPCFSWSMSNASGFVDYTVTVSTTPDFPTSRWMYKLTSISSTSICWNNGVGWQYRGSATPVDPGPLQNGTTYYWRVLASYSDGAITGRDFVGYSFTNRVTASSTAATSSSRSSSSLAATSSRSSSSTISSSRSSSSSVVAIQSKTTRYTYDALGRLTFVEDSQNGNRDYDYDAAGNRLQVSTNTTNDATAEPGGSLLPAPTNLYKSLIYSCAWKVTWNSVTGAAKYVVVDTNGASQWVTIPEAVIACPVGNSSGNMPQSVQACNASNVCGPKANF